VINTNLPSFSGGARIYSLGAKPERQRRRRRDRNAARMRWEGQEWGRVSPSPAD